MRLGIFAKTFPGEAPEPVLAAVSAAGFSVAQYNMACSGLPPMPDEIPPGVAAAVGAAAKDRQVEIVALSGTYNMIHPDPAVRAAGHRRLEVLAANAAAMSTRLITLCTGTRDAHDQWRAHPDNDTPEAWADLLASMEVAIGIADRHGVDLGIEPELANVVNSAAKARRLIDELRSSRLRIVFDPANLFEAETIERQLDIVARGIDLLADRIVMGHAKDRDAEGGFVTAGQGVLDYPHYLARLAAGGFDGPMVAHGLAAREAEGVARFLLGVMGAAGVEVTR
ncbi:sugar phosphate isomerase/epimerase family protein [Arvimicrobium flavum]|uniref:sugar phosphate isomerase/epimerase family protein n=1 Tax=Arvimicrobium flavum TaxID=3393320 RepID=UPI00237A13F4|nr:sugar phosphate isomerase/epimerase [Mesorhizobium shangrilense]